MSKEKIKAIMAKAKAEKRQLTPDEVKEIKTLEAEKETASQDPNKPAAAADKAAADKAAADKAAADKAAADKAAAAKNTTKKPKLVKVKILKSVAGTFYLSANVGEEVKYPEPLAAELIQAKYAEKA